MNKTIKTRWIKALLSGKYKQASGRLKDTDKNGKPTFCVLGVLCDLHRRTKAGRSWSRGARYMGQGFRLPATVAKWAGLDSTDPQMTGALRTLATMNDDGYSFKRLAKVIQTEL